VAVTDRFDNIFFEYFLNIFPTTQYSTIICKSVLSNLYNKRACPQTMFKILRLRRQHCQMELDNRVAKKWRWERDEIKNV
jgi:hypothetical protein